MAEHLRPLGIRYDAEVVAAVAEAGEALGAVRQNAAFRLHEDGADPETVSAEVARWGLLSPDRAAKAVEFLTHPTWRAYLTCYVEGLPLCRDFVAGDPARFDRLLSEQLTPDVWSEQIRIDRSRSRPAPPVRPVQPVRPMRAAPPEPPPRPTPGPTRA